MSALTRLITSRYLGLLVVSSGLAVIGIPAETPLPRVVIHQFTAGGQPQDLILNPPSDGDLSGPWTYDEIRLGDDTQSFDFIASPHPNRSDHSGRIKYQLIGWDEELLDSEGTMWLWVYFLDKDGQRFDRTILPRSGQSQGWTGNAHPPEFHVSSEVLVTPPGTDRIQIVLGSGGSAQTTGTWLIKSLRISDMSLEGGSILLDENFDLGPDPAANGSENWRRMGSTFEAGNIQYFDSNSAGRALALLDYDTSTNGRWAGQGSTIFAARPGMTLRVETAEAYSIGKGGHSPAKYQKLPPGRYQFRAIPVDVYGIPSGMGVELPLVIVPPSYTTWWFWVGITLVGAVGLTYGVRYRTWKKLSRQIEASEQRRAIEEERMRIAQDIHDDMGARLTQISLLSNSALRRAPADSALNHELQSLSRATRDVVIALDEIVWAVNPANDTLEGLGNYVSQYVTELAAASKVRCRLDIPTLLPDRSVSSGQRHQLMMALKEALNNALKHAAATTLKVQLSFEDPKLTIRISDNGRGFDPDQTSDGNGLSNMDQRLHAIAGTCQVDGTLAEGTVVTFTLELKN